MTNPEKMRAVALAYKLGELGESLEKPKEDTEKWLTFAVETVLKHVLQVSPSTPSAGTPNEEADNLILVTELTGCQLLILLRHLKLWEHSIRELENLSEWILLIVSGEAEHCGSYAMPLMLQAVSILIPPAPQESNPEDKCRGKS